MNKVTDCVEFDVLGVKVRFRPEQSSSDIPPLRVVEYITKLALEMKKSSPNVDATRLAVLIALKAVEEKMVVEEDYKETLLTFEKEITDLKQALI